LRLRSGVLVLAFALLFQGDPALSGQSLSGVLEGLNKTYGDLPGLSLPYTREIITRSMSMLGDQVKGDLATGKIFFKTPHFLRVEQETPRIEIIVTDGELLWWYIPEEKSARLYPYQEFGQELRMLSDVFRGLSNAEERFVMAMLDRGPSGEYRIELRPDPPWQEIDRIGLSITECHQIRQVDIYNQVGGITRFMLEAFTAKESFPEDFFRFVPPEGVKVVEE
jgi:outer membrane lipoprotein-sorting protein